MLIIAFTTFDRHLKGSSTPSDYAMVTVTLTGGTFDLLQIFKGAARQRYGDRSVIARCE